MSVHAPHTSHSFNGTLAGRLRSSGLKEWRFWLLIQLAVCAVLTVAFLFDAAEPFLYVVLGVATVGTLVRSYKDAKFLDAETKAASSQVEQLAELGDMAEFLREAKPSMFKSHIESLYTIFQVHPEIQQDHLVEILHARLLARNRIVELFASLLLTLGLIGTIVGLITMMDGMKGALTGETGESRPAAVASGEAGADAGGEDKGMMQRLQEPLSGLGIAFNTTLIGAVFGGVILRILSSVVDAAITRYVAHLAELTEVQVLPTLRRVAMKLERSGYYNRNEIHPQAA